MCFSDLRLQVKRFSNMQKILMHLLHMRAEILKTSRDEVITNESFEEANPAERLLQRRMTCFDKIKTIWPTKYSV